MKHSANGQLGWQGRSRSCQGRDSAVGRCDGGAGARVLGRINERGTAPPIIVLVKLPPILPARTKVDRMRQLPPVGVEAGGTTEGYLLV